MKPPKTESEFSTNKQISEINGNSINKNDNHTDLNVTFYDIDYAIKYYIDNRIKPTVIENDYTVAVPSIFSNGEKWATIQKHGYLRDNQGKLLTPLIMIKRNSAAFRDGLRDGGGLETPDNRLVIERKYTKDNKYDRFNLTHKKPNRELYSLDVPKYITVEYDLLIWTNNTTQLNHLVELLMWHSHKAWGDTYKFTTAVENPTFDTVNATGEDRLVRATMNMTTNGYLLINDESTASMYKLNPPTNFKITAKEIT